MGLTTNYFRVWLFGLASLVWLPHGSFALAGEFGFSGMHVQGMNSITAKALGMSKPIGVLVRNVALGGPANKAGIQRGDLILRFGKTSISNFKSLVEEVLKTRPGDEVRVLLSRRGKDTNVKLKLGSKPASWKIKESSVLSISAVGLTLAAITDKIRDRFSIPWGSFGVLVTLVDSKLDERNYLQRGDVIVQINQQAVWLPAQIRAAYDDAKKNGLGHLLMLVERASGFEFMTLPVN